LSGLVAVIAHGEAVLSGPEADGLASTYADLRGEANRSSHSGGRRIHAVRFRRPASARADVESVGDSWVVSVGVPHHRGSLTSAPLKEIDGAFALARYDAESDTALVACDPFGMQCLYSARRGERTYVSTSALALAKHLGARPSPLGVCTYLRTGMACGPETHWDGIERLEPGAVIRVSPRASEVATYWRPTPDRTVAQLSLRETAAHCIEALSGVVLTAEILPGAAWTDLTGGFDSRILTLCLRRAGMPFVANTSGGPNDQDVVIAERLSKLGGWEWQRFALPEDWNDIVVGRLQAALAWGDGLLDVTQLSRVLWNHERKAGRHDMLFIGGGGEHLRNFAWQQEFFAAGRSREVNWKNWLGMRMLSPVDPAIFSKDPTPAVHAGLKRRMSAWIEPYADELNTVKLDMLYAYKSTGHFGSYRSAAAAFLDAELPFYSKPVFVAATSSNFRFRNHHRLARQIVSMLDPRIAAVETATGGPAEPWKLTNVHRFAPYYARVGQRAANKIAQRTFGRHIFKPRAAARNLTHERNAGLQHLDAKGGSRYEDLRLGRLLDRKAYDELVGRIRKCEPADTLLLGRIVTAELALRASDGFLDSSV
jgi:hypothetical protein